MDSLSSTLLKEGLKPFTDAGVNTDGESGELMVLPCWDRGQLFVHLNGLILNRTERITVALSMFVNSLLPGRLFLHSLQFSYFSL